MGRGLRAFILTIILVGCGANSAPNPTAGFVNQTWHSDADLWTIWKTAQQGVAQKVDLNPVEQSIYQAPAHILPGDSRAFAVKPHQLLVAAEPDVSSAILWAETGVERADPTGMIACPQPCNVRYSTAYSLYQPPRTRYAASWEFAGTNFSGILEYEFENQILFALGYDMRWR
jgi:hypothetical protein